MKEEITEEKRVENRKFLSAYMGVVSGIICAYLFGYIGSVYTSDLTSAIQDTLSSLTSMSFFYELNSGGFLGIAAGIVAGALVYFMNTLHDEKYGAYKMDEVAGSARFMNKKELKEYMDKYIKPEPTDESTPSPNMIMSRNFCRPMDARQLIGNNNVMIIGGAGSGKSRFFIKPNVLQMNASYVVTDPSGEMIYALGEPLKKAGYKIKIFNITDMKYSNCYNPLQYIRDEAGVNMLIDCFIKNTTEEGAKGDQFWTNAERLLYSACIFYLVNHCQDESRKNFGSLINMINASAVDENNPNTKSDLDLLFDELPKDSLAWKTYKAFKQAAGKTLKSIIISCVTRLRPFLTPQVANLTKTDTLELEKLGDEKTALFIITPQADRTYAFLASMLYSQLFETLYFKCEEQKKLTGSERLKIPVRCLMDEFANIGEVPEFPSKLATMRKYNISATIVLQDISQIESMYKDEWKTLVGNCSSIVFLGTQEPNTLKYFSEMLGKGTVKNKNRGISKGKMNGASQNFQNTGRELRFADELGRMSPKKCIVFTQNMRPVNDDKYQYEEHPRYKLTGDYDEKLGFKYSEMPIYNNTRYSITHILKAKSETARIARQEIVTDPRPAKDAKLAEPCTKAMDQMQLTDEVEQEAFAFYLVDAQGQLNERNEDVVPYAVLNNVSPKRLIKIAKQLKGQHDRFLLFTKINGEKDTLCISYDSEKSIYPYMDVPFLKYMEAKGTYVVASLSVNRIEEYITKITKAFKKDNADAVAAKDVHIVEEADETIETEEIEISEFDHDEPEIY